MKKTLLYSTILLNIISFQLAAQCLTDNHSNAKEDAWISCQMSMSPNSARGFGHWIQYDFGYPYPLSDTHVWNANEAGNTNKGLKNVVIDYSLDGATWTALSGTHQFPQATGANTYAGFVGPDFAGIYARYVLVTATDNWGATCYGLSEMRFNIEANPSLVQVKVLLEGAYTNNGMMSSNLNALLPNNQPFNAAPWQYNGLESVAAIPTNVVDWVLVELRDGNDRDNIVARKAAFLLNNGDVVDINGVANGVNFSTIVSGNDYYVLLRSRHHLDVISSNAVVMTATNLTYDFTTADAQALGVDQLKEVENGVFALHSGDMNGDGIITVVDFNQYVDDLNNNSINQYHLGDINMDGNVTVGDFNKYRPNASLIGVSVVRY